MREWLDRWGIIVSIVTIVATVAGATWVVSNRISEVETRISVVEAKLDLLIEGLNIQVSPKTASIEGDSNEEH